MPKDNNDSSLNNQEIDEKNSKSTIQRANHQSSFFSCERKAAQNKALSLQAKGLLALLLSFSDNFVIYKDSLCQFSKNGRDGTRAAFDELIKAKYLYKYEYLNERNLRRIKYYLFEIPYDENSEEFKKRFPYAEKPRAVMPRAEKPRLNNTNIDNTYLDNTNNKDVASEDAPFLSTYFFKKLKEIRTNRPEPNWYSWNRDIDLLMRQKELSREEVIGLIDFVMDVNNTFVVESPTSLKKKYERIADHIEIEKKRKSTQDIAKRDPRMAKTIDIINEYTSRVMAGTMVDDYSFIIKPDGGIYHTHEKRNYPRTFDKFMEAIKDKGAPESMILRIKTQVN